MSVQAISWVLEHGHAQGADRLVLIAIANYAGKSPVDGAWESWPAIETIAEEARLDSLKTVKQAVGRLVKAGDIERVINGAPDSRLRRDQRPNLYRILVAPRSLASQRRGPGRGAVGRFSSSDVGCHPVLSGRRAKRTGSEEQVWVVAGEIVDPCELDASRGVVGEPPVDGSTGASDTTPGTGQRGDVGLPPADVAAAPVDNPTNGQRGVVPRPHGGSSHVRTGGTATSARGVVAVPPNQNDEPENDEPYDEPSTHVSRAELPPTAPVETLAATARAWRVLDHEARNRRLRDLMGRRTDRPTPTTGLGDAGARLHPNATPETT